MRKSAATLFMGEEGAAFDQSTNGSANNLQGAADGGEGGIRTHGELAPTAVFKTAALNHSATSPKGESHPGFSFARVSDGDGLCKARDECNGRRAAWRLA